MIVIQKEVPYPAFKQVGSEILTRKLYEYRMVNGKLVVIDLPQPGQLPEYLTRLEFEQWNRDNLKFLKDHATKK